ncbi:hypothetical protein [Streptomyces sp. NPDC021224]|uniref:hypothetical protein n=1 Tax=unclassified Streptomyces TaxID=2593676 RepID=UPI0037942C80
MTLDAMHWVWTHSQAKGNTRLALLYVADQVRTPACEVRLSYPDFLGALNTESRGTVKGVIEAAVKSGELEIVEAGAGRRKPLYRLPMAVDYVRPVRRNGPESGPQEDTEPAPCGPEFGPQGIRSSPVSGPQSDGDESASGPDSGPQDGRCGPEIDPPYPSLPSKHEESRPEGSTGSDYGIPDAVRPLVDSMTASGVAVRWPFSGDQWFPVLALIKKCGIPALVEYARRTADRTHVDSARYFMRGWAELPPRPAEGTPVYAPRPHLRAVGTPEERGIF